MWFGGCGFESHRSRVFLFCFGTHCIHKIIVIFVIDEGVINETEEEHKEVIARLGKLREYVEMLQYKDKELERFCQERFATICDIMTVYDHGDILQQVSAKLKFSFDEL